MKYTVTYYDAKGNAEIVRLVFAAAGQEFTDERFGFDDKGSKEWEKRKPGMFCLNY